MEFQKHVSTEQDCVQAVTLYTCGRKQHRSNIDLATIIFEIFHGFSQSLLGQHHAVGHEYHISTSVTLYNTASHFIRLHID